MRKKTFIFVAMLLYCFTTTQIYASIRYVKPLASGLGDGSSWVNASGDFQAMINASASGDEVWVAAGTYKPTYDPFGSSSPADPRDKTFFVKDGVKIYGGFAGTETALSQRLITTNVTILSGDVDGNDVVTGSGSTLSITNNTENVYHIVLASTSSGGVGVTIDGFTITGGNANKSDPTSASNLTINGNQIDRANGGGIYIANGTNTISNNTLFGNSVLGSGAGVYTYYGMNTITNNTLFGNSAANSGGGGIASTFGTNTHNNNNISGNSGRKGGGILVAQGTNIITNNTISGNSATLDGGGILSFASNNLITNNTVSGNTTGNNGAGINIYYGNTTLSNNTISGNTAVYSGGGIWVSYGTHNVNNNTIFGNSAANGGGVYTTRIGSALIVNFNNNILWGNKKGTDATIVNADFYNFGATVTFTNNLLQLVSSGYNSTNKNGLGTSPTGNIFATDPLFVNATDIDGADNLHRTADDGLRLKPCSPAINSGANSTEATDIIGATRIQQTTVDMGAYENKDLTGYTLSSSVLNADAECADASSITHYYNSSNEVLVLSIKKNGNDIGSIGDGTFAVTSGGSGVSNLGTSGTPAPYATAYNWFTMNRYWKVTPTTQPSSDVQVRFYYRPADYTNVQSIAGIANETNMVFYKINGTGNPDPTTAHTGTPIVPASAYNADGYWQYTNGATSSPTNWALGTYGTHKYSETVVAMFSGGGGGSGSGFVGGALPISLTSFKGRAQNKANVLEWSTSSEQNNKGFNLQHSANNLDFKTLGFITGSNGNTSKNYAYTHSNPFAGVNYYRLQQIDLDGKSSFSKTISIDNKLNGSIVAKPNPSNGIFTFQGIDFSDYDEKISYNLIDLLGKKIDAKVNRNTLDIRQEPNGIYYLQILQNGTIIQTTKLVKN
jgi:parallel beta-helix repeat protein